MDGFFFSSDLKSYPKAQQNTLLIYVNTISRISCREGYPDISSIYFGVSLFIIDIIIVIFIIIKVAIFLLLLLYIFDVWDFLTRSEYFG